MEFFTPKEYNVGNLDLHKDMSGAGNGINESQTQFIFFLFVIAMKDN